jgi:hypothetical protein
MPRTCRAPGCKTKISARSASGMCRQHNHTQGLCLCLQCQARGRAGKPSAVLPPEIKPEPPASPATTRQWMPRATEHFSAPAVKPVTLPIEPWNVAR